MDIIIAAIIGPWPWYVAGPLIGLTVPLLLFLGNKRFGLSSNLRHMCAIAPPTSAALADMGLAVDGGLAPAALFSWSSLSTPRGFVVMVLGGFLIGFGARWAGGCTSGHAIMGISELQWPSLLAAIGFFAGGVLATHLLLPIVLGL